MKGYSTYLSIEIEWKYMYFYKKKNVELLYLMHFVFKLLLINSFKCWINFTLKYLINLQWIILVLLINVFESSTHFAFKIINALLFELINTYELFCLMHLAFEIINAIESFELFWNNRV